MGHFSVVLELAVFKFVEADKALGVVLQLDENPLGRHAADDAGVALPQVGLHILGDIAVLGGALPGDGPHLCLGGLGRGQGRELAVAALEGGLVRPGHQAA